MAAGLLGYAALLAVIGPRVLRRGTWPARAPRLGILAWQALSLSVLTSPVLAGLALAAPTAPFDTNLAAVLRACLMALQHGYATPASVGVALAGLVLAAAVAARSASCLAGGLARSARERSRHAQALSLVARDCEHPGTVVLDHATPAAYCLPGRHRRVVLTSAALAALDETQLQAVLAHEQAHLTGRHHLVVGAAAGLRRAFPRAPVFVGAHEEIARLVELVADDAAAARHGRLPVAAAMVTMATGEAPSMALAAGGAGALERVRRLVGPARPLGPGVVLAGFALAVALLVVPALAAAAPALAAAGMPACPMTSTGASTVMGPGCHATGMAGPASTFKGWQQATT
ncbi:MAG: M56 family metallopeptidase [Acidimicrobiales bacterium]